MPRMKISGQTSGKLIFAYDIREDHIDYNRLLPLFSERLKNDGYDILPSKKELEEVIGEMLYKTNEKVFENLERLFLFKEFNHSNIAEILDDTLKELYELNNLKTNTH